MCCTCFFSLCSLLAYNRFLVAIISIVYGIFHSLFMAVYHADMSSCWNSTHYYEPKFGHYILINCTTRTALDNCILFGTEAEAIDTKSLILAWILLDWILVVGGVLLLITIFIPNWIITIIFLILWIISMLTMILFDASITFVMFTRYSGISNPALFYFQLVAIPDFMTIDALCDKHAVDLINYTTWKMWNLLVRDIYDVIGIFQILVIVKNMIGQIGQGK